MKRIVVAALASLACAQTVQARDKNTGAYIGGSLVRGTITEVFRVDVGTPGSTVDRNDYGFQLQGGY